MIIDPSQPSWYSSLPARLGSVFWCSKSERSKRQGDTYADGRISIGLDSDSDLSKFPNLYDAHSNCSMS